MHSGLARSLLVILALQFVCQSAWARPGYPDVWKGIYPDAPDPFVLGNCQLCHENVGGGDGWNSYGWRIRVERNDGSVTIENAITFADQGNSDGDTAGNSNLLEIESGTQPGWRALLNNTIRYKNGSSISVSAASRITDPLVLSNLDVPAPNNNPFPASIPTAAEATVTTIASGVVSAGVTLVSPITAASAPGLAGYLFVADQIGKIHKINLSSLADSQEFIDISDFMQNLSPGYDERGLLGFAFHPDFATNGLFYTSHSEPAGTAIADFQLASGAPNHQSVISEWSAINPADPGTLGQTATKRDLLRIDQPASNHNGGGIVFDQNNYLLIALGDGGSADDFFGNGNNPLTPLGSILRIDPSGLAGSTSANGAYSIPSDNPFVADAEKLNEAFAFGLRNPYSLTIDRSTNRIYAGDVGQNDIEEIDRIISGGNYGWNAKEGSFFFFPNLGGNGFVSANPSTRANNTMIDPILEYDQYEGRSAVAGPVYRGSDLSQLQGAYLFGDWIGSGSEGRLFFSTDFSTVQEVSVNSSAGLDMFLTGFGEDSQSEVYLLGKTVIGPSGTTGMIKKLTGIELVEPMVQEDEICFPIAGADGNTAVICL